MLRRIITASLVLAIGVSVSALVMAQDTQRVRQSPLERLRAIQSTAATIKQAPSDQAHTPPQAMAPPAAKELPAATPQAAAGDSEIILTQGIDHSAGRRMGQTSRGVTPLFDSNSPGLLPMLTGEQAQPRTAARRAPQRRPQSQSVLSRIAGQPPAANEPTPAPTTAPRPPANASEPIRVSRRPADGPAVGAPLQLKSEEDAADASAPWNAKATVQSTEVDIDTSDAPRRPAPPLTSSRRDPIEPEVEPEVERDLPTSSRRTAPVLSPQESAPPAEADDASPQKMSLSAEEPEPAPRIVDQATPTVIEPPEDEDDSSVLLSLSGPQLSARASGPRRIVVSQQSEYKVMLRNSGDVEANDVTVSINIPSWVDVAGISTSSGSAKDTDDTSTGRKVSWRINKLEANSQETVSLNIIPRKSQPIDLSVRWTYAHAGSQAMVEVEEPMLNMVVSGPSEVVFGQTKIYNLTISNPGTGDAHNVVVRLLPLGGKEERTASQNMGTLRRGESKTIQVELAAGKSGSLLVKAQAEADGGLVSEASKEVLVRRADLEMEIVGPRAQYAGNPAEYRLRVTNPGNATAQDVTVVAVLPPGTEFLRASDDARLIKGQGRVRWDLGALAAGQQRTMDLGCLLHSEGDNPVRAAAQDNTDLTASAVTNTNVIVRADLKLTVSDPQGPVPVGEEAYYELKIQNRGTKAAEDIEAVVFFSEGIEPQSVEGAEHEIGRGQVVFQTIPKLAAGGEMLLKIRAVSDRPGDHIFRAEILCRALGTKLAAEETTHYYGDELDDDQNKPTSAAARPREPLEPAPLRR